VLSIQANGANANWSDVTLKTALGVTAGPTSFVRFTGIKKNDAPGFPRIANVLAVSAAPPYSVTIAYRPRFSTPVTPTKGNVYQSAFLYTPIYQWEFERFGEHKTGRPTYTPRGRLSAAIRRV
jgi:hypothetical protein